MKKIILIIAFFCSTISLVTGQTKPSLEVTLDFISNVFDESEGIAIKSISSTWGTGTMTYSYRAPTKYSIEYTQVEKFPGQETFYHKFYLSFNAWRNLLLAESENKDQDGLTEVTINFSSPFSVTTEYFSEDRDSESKQSYRNKWTFQIINQKAESFKKALYRLAEIDREANKDPFAN